MFKTLRDAWSIPEIRKKLLYTLLMLLIFRLGSAVVVPFLDTSTVSTWMASNATGGNFLEYLDIITGGALSQATVFSLSILHVYFRTEYHPVHYIFYHHAAADLCTASAGAYA